MTRWFRTVLASISANKYQQIIHSFNISTRPFPSNYVFISHGLPAIKAADGGDQETLQDQSQKAHEARTVECSPKSSP